MTDTEKTVKINEMVETYCAACGGHMKEALKKAMNDIVYPKTDVPAHADFESFQAYMIVRGIITFLEDSFILSAHQTGVLLNFAADLHYE